MKSFKTSRTGKWNLLRLGPLEAGVVDTEVTTIVAAVATTEMIEMVVMAADEVIPEAIVIQMTGRSEERKIEHLVSRTITANTIVATGREIARVVAVGEDVMIVVLVIEIVNAKAGKSNTFPPDEICTDRKTVMRRMIRSEHVRRTMMRNQRRKLTASPTSHQQSRPKNPQQPMARSVLERMMTQSRPQPRRWTASQMKLHQSRLRPLQQMGGSVLVRMMKQLNLPQRRLIPSLRLLLKPHDNPRFTILFKCMHFARGCIKGVYLGGAACFHECFLSFSLWQFGLGSCRMDKQSTSCLLATMVACVHMHTNHRTTDYHVQNILTE
jgi:hypothetical protein